MKQKVMDLFFKARVLTISCVDALILTDGSQSFRIFTHEVQITINDAAGILRAERKSPFLHFITLHTKEKDN